MSAYEHLPTRVDAVLWDGDLAVVSEFITGGTEAHRDAISDVLWVTQKIKGRTNVFPVAPRHYLVRDAATGALSGMSAHAFLEQYRMRQPVAA